jgi:hypothetical protein
MKGIVPRPIYRAFLVMAAIFIGHSLWVALSYSILTYISGLLGTFTLFVANFSWTLKDKVDQAFNGESSNSANFLKVREFASSIIERSNFETAYLSSMFGHFQPSTIWSIYKFNV